jgi:hypothetical protein
LGALLSILKTSCLSDSIVNIHLQTLLVTYKIIIRHIAKTGCKMADLPLIQFNNWRDPRGYRLENSNQLVVRNGRRNDNFDVLEPLKMNRALYSAFANEVVTAEGLLKFVQSHGPLTNRGNDQGDEVHYVLWHAARMRDCLKLVSARRRTGRPAKGFGISAIPLHAAIDWDPETNIPRWVMRPNTLVDGLWLQFGQAITRGARLQTCRLCGEWFEVGYPGDRRLDSKFCRDEHRVQYNSRKRSKGE